MAAMTRFYSLDVKCDEVRLELRSELGLFSARSYEYGLMRVIVV